MDPETSIQEAIEETKRAIEQLRESVVAAIMYRNRLQEEVARRESEIAKLQQKLPVAAQMRDPSIAKEIEEEISKQQRELASLKENLRKAETEAEALKARRPEEEARLNSILRDLQARRAQGLSTWVGSSQPGYGTSEAEVLLERAGSKVEELQAESQARQQASAPSPQQPTDVEKTAEQLLMELEKKYGLTRTEPQVPTQEETSSVQPSSEGTTEPASSAETKQDQPAMEPVESQELVVEPEAPTELTATPLLNGGLTTQEMQALLEPEPPYPSETQTSKEPQEEPSAQPAESPWEYTTSTTIGPAETLEVLPGESLQEIESKPSEELREPPQAIPTPEEALAKETLVVAPQEELLPVVEELAEEELSTKVAEKFYPITRPQEKPIGYDPSYRVRVAAIGTGSIFRGAHLPCYPLIPQAKLVALCDPDPNALQQAHRRLQALAAEQMDKARERHDDEAIERIMRDLDEVRLFSDISEVIAEVHPDLVDICTQPVLHVPLAIQALEAGIHVMCEKPIARSWLETERLLATLERTDRFYQHNENWLYDPDYYTARKLIAAGAIGEPLLMFLATAHGGPEGNPKFWNPAFGGGGSLLDNGIHAIGAAWFLSGLEKRPTMVKAVEPYGMSIRMPLRIIDGRYQQVSVDDDAHILIRFEDAQSGAWTNAHVEGSWSHRDSPDTVIIGTTGRIHFTSQEGRRYVVVTDAYEREVRRIEATGPTWQFWPSSFYGEILNMVQCVRSGTPPISDARFGADCSAVVGAAYLSEKKGRAAVSIEEFRAFARSIAQRYPNDTQAADDALVEELLSAVRKN